MTAIYSATLCVTIRVHSKLKGQNSRTSQGHLKDLKLQFSSTQKSIDKKTYHTRATSKFRVKYIIYSAILH